VVDHNDKTIGWEGCFIVPPGCRDQIEIHAETKEGPATTGISEIRLPVVKDDSSDDDSRDYYVDSRDYDVVNGTSKSGDGTGKNPYKIDEPPPPTPTIDDSPPAVDDSPPVDNCLEDKWEAAGKLDQLWCQRKEVYLESVKAFPRQKCVEGETITVDISASIKFTGPRLDFGSYLALDGGDALHGQCALNILDLDSTDDYKVTDGCACSSETVVGSVQSNDVLPSGVDPNDDCGDVVIPDGGSASIATDLLIQTDMTCMDTNNDKFMDFAICFTWRHAATDGICDPTGPFPGENKGCWCERYNVKEITVEKPAVTACE
jgi:hypothetical protein